MCYKMLVKCSRHLHCRCAEVTAVNCATKSCTVLADDLSTEWVTESPRVYHLMDIRWDTTVHKCNLPCLFLWTQVLKSLIYNNIYTLENSIASFKVYLDTTYCYFVGWSVAKLLRNIFNHVINLICHYYFFCIIIVIIIIINPALMRNCLR